MRYKVGVFCDKVGTCARSFTGITINCAEVMPRTRTTAARGGLSARGEEGAGEPVKKKSKTHSVVGKVPRLLNFTKGPGDEGSGGEKTYIGEDEDYPIGDDNEDPEQQWAGGSR